MKKFVILTILFNLLFSYPIYSQGIASYNDAVEIFNKFPAKYDFEGIYEIQYDSKIENVKVIKGDANVKNQDFNGFFTKGELICIFHLEDDIVGFIIGKEGPAFHFMVPEKGKLYFSCVFKSSPRNIYAQLTFIPDNKEVVGPVEIDNSDLLFTVKMPTAYTEMQYANHAYYMDVTSKYKFKKKYSPQVPIQKSFGTGFAISSDGYIVTNNHVVNEGKKIEIKGVNGDFQKTYVAKVIATDKDNDLAILKIVDSSFMGFNKIPYSLIRKLTDVGNSVFVLGYPLVTYMGQEIKLTNGIISSKTGFQGDVSTYQISVPLQPGNSGGPMFDSKGNVVGIVSSRLSIGENVSYAIKTSVLFNLIESLPTIPKIETENILKEQSLAEQVKSIKNYVFIIEVQL